jgi:hypothetical protein
MGCVLDGEFLKADFCSEFIQLTNKCTNKLLYSFINIDVFPYTCFGPQTIFSGVIRLVHFTLHVKRGPKSTLVLVISYKTFEFVKCETVKLIILSCKLKSRFKIAALSLGAQNCGIVFVVEY